MEGLEIHLKVKRITVLIVLFGIFEYLYFLNAESIGNFDKMLSSFNVLFGTDIPRVINNLTDYSPEYNRTVVHPLFVLFLNKIGVFLSWCFNTPITAVEIMTSIAGAVCVCLMFILLLLLDVEMIGAFILSLIFGFTSGQMLYASIPETYIFAAATLIIGVIAYVYVNKKEKNHILLPLSGILTFGITITNYLQTLILTIFQRKNIQLEKKNNINDKSQHLNTLSSGTIIAISLIAFFTILQGFIYPKITMIDYRYALNELRFTHIGDKAAGDILNTPNMYSKERKEEISKLNVFQTSKTLAINFGAYSFLAVTPDQIFMKDYGEVNEGIGVVFNNNCIKKYTPAQLLALFILWVFILYGIYIGVRYHKKIGFALLACLLLNIVIHFFYGTLEAYIFIEHVIYLSIAFIGIGMSNLKKNKMLYSITLMGLVLVLIIMIDTNYKFIEYILSFLRGNWS